MSDNPTEEERFSTVEMTLQQYTLYNFDILRKEIAERGVSRFVIEVDSSPDFFPHKPGGPVTNTYTLKVTVP